MPGLFACPSHFGTPCQAMLIPESAVQSDKKEVCVRPNGQDVVQYAVQVGQVTTGCGVEQRWHRGLCHVRRAEIAAGMSVKPERIAVRLPVARPRRMTKQCTPRKSESLAVIERAVESAVSRKSLLTSIRQTLRGRKSSSRSRS